MCRFRKGDTVDCMKGMVFFVNLGDENDTKHGTIMRKVRPCVIVSRDEGFNELNPSRYTVIPITTREEGYIFSITDVLFTYGGCHYAAIVDHIITVSHLDIKGYKYTLNKSIMEKIDKAIQVHLGYASPSILDITEDDLKDYKEYKQEKENKHLKLVTETTPTNSDIDVTTKESDIESGNKEEDDSVLLDEQVPSRESMRKRSPNSWNYKEIEYFLNQFETNNTAQVAAMFGINMKKIYQVKHKLKNKLIERDKVLNNILLNVPQ